MKDNVEAAFRRRTLVGKGMVGDVKTVVTGWACECGKEVEPSTTLMKCIGCEGVDIGKIDSRGKIAREIALAKTTLAWT